ncbi:hypothetical protein [Halorussus aquaticus]|uniref:Uncharacterized protein n=1 Tax=Halorussus aquaticus TaxID=2953748 RepID=A0ABD5Q1F6_9EURY|nr:hypothetical protein [Halorussus aquaticus]
MTGVVELLASVGSSAPIQRVRNYHLTRREARPRAHDFLTAMRRTDGGVCARWAGPPGDCFVRYTDPGWQRAEYNRFRGRRTVEPLDVERVREWFRNSRPELVAYDEVRDVFRESPDASVESGIGVSADGGCVSDERVRVARYADLLGDPTLDRRDADALAAALPAGPREIVFDLPGVLAEESVLESVAASDRVFVAEVVPERETERAYYVRQDRRGCWVPKGEATVYELADGAALDLERAESGESV